MLWFTEWRESVCVILIWVLPFMDFFYDDDILRVLFHGDVFFCGDDLMIIVIYDKKRLFSRWVGVCRCFRKTGDIHNMAETIFLRYIFTFHFYMLCLIASLTMTYCLICVFFCSSVFIAYSIKICILFTLYSECVYLSPFSCLQNCAEKKATKKYVYLLQLSAWP